MGLVETTAAVSTVKRYWKWIVALATVAVGGVAVLAVLAFVTIEAAKTAPSDVALADIPPPALEAYLAAGDHCNGLTWNVLAGIGKVESNHGRVFGGVIDADGDVVPPIFGAALNGSGAGGNTTPWPSGQWEGQWGLQGPWLRALGPMQFISPSWAAFGQDGNGDGTENPHNIFDGAQSAAQLLCQSQGGEITDIRDALFSYNRSTEYGELVLHWARLYVALPFGAFDGTAEDLLNHPNIELHPRARGDLEAGVVDPRLISALVTAAEDFTMYIGWFKTGHSECVGGGSIAQRPGCTISNHHFGRAADIGAVGFAGDGDRPLVRPNNDAARALTTRWGTMDLEDPLRPESLGSPWDTGVFQGHFTDGNHNDHLHVAWRSDPPPPAAIEATRHGLDDVELFPSPPSSEWFVPVVLPARTNEVLVGPADVQAAIDNAAPSTRIVLAPGFYGPITVRNPNGLSITGSPDGVATLASGALDRGAGIIVEGGSDITISGLSFTDALWAIQVWESTDVLITGNTITRVGQEGIHVGRDSSNVTISNNTISHTGQRPGVDEEQGLPFRTFGEGIYIGTGRPAGVDMTNNVRIVGNEIHHTSAEAIDIKPGTHDITVERNIIHDISTQTSGAVVVHIGDLPSNNGNISIRRNLIWNVTRTSQFTDANAISVSGPAHVQANIIWDTQHRGVLVSDVYGPQRDVTVRRNMVFDTALDDVEVWDHSPALTTLSVVDNIDGSVFAHEAFQGGWINDNRPTETLALLVAALDDDTVPITDLESVFAPQTTFPAWDGTNLRRPGDWPIRNVNLDGRTQFLNTPASELDWAQFTEPSDRAIALGPVTPTKLLGQFRTQCSFSHFAYDDPLVFPGEFGAAHLHMFFGNTLADANSTGGSIRDTGSSTCNGFEGNRSGYWIPAAFDGQGDARIPSRIEVYYKTHSNQAGNAIEPPLGLGIIAGTAATNREIEWACQETGAQGQNLNRPIQQRQNTIPRCSSTATLLAHIKFPQCLANPDSVSANGTNGTGQLSYPLGGFFAGNCAAGTQYITAIEFFIAWAPDNHDGNTDQWWLSSDVNPQTGERAPNGSTLHGDWFNGWNPALMDEIFENCIGRLAECSWDLVQSNHRLIQVEHFGRTHSAAYSGPREIPASDVSNLLCPGDTFDGANDVAYCLSREVGYGPSAQPIVPRGGGGAAGDVIVEASFDGTPTGPYSAGDVASDFGAVRWADTERASIVAEGANRFLRVEFPAGGVGPGEGGAQFRTDLRGRSADELFLSYRVRFGAGFDWSLGGKLPGLAGGTANTGGNRPNGRDGWSARMMWRQNGAATQYVYHPAQPGQFGDTTFWDAGFATNQWIEVEHQVRLNTPGRSDGFIRGWMNGRLVLDLQGMRFRDTANIEIDSLLFSTFFGGSTPEWAPDRDVHVDFDDFVVSAPGGGRQVNLEGSLAGSGSFSTAGFVEPVWTGSIDGEAVVPVLFRSDRDLILEPPRRRRDVDGDGGATVGGADPLHFCSLVAPGTWEPITEHRHT